MKKVFSLLLVLILCLLSVSANASGVFVPDYPTFMDAFCANLDEKLAESIKLHYADNGVWKETIYLSSYGLIGDKLVKIDPEWKIGFLDKLEISVTVDAYETYQQEFDSLIRAAMLALRNDWTDDDVSAMREALLISTIVSTPVESMHQYTNSGVYRYSFHKSYGEYTFTIEFSLYS